MTTSPTTVVGEQTLYAALELSKNSWLLAIQAPGHDNPWFLAVGSSGSHDGVERVPDGVDRDGVDCRRGLARGVVL